MNRHETSKDISDSFVDWIITMLRNLCRPVTMKILGLGCPLQNAERIAAVMVVWVVLLFVMMGYTVSVSGMPERVPDDAPGYRRIPYGTAPVSMCRNLPVNTGFSFTSSRSVLHTR